MPKICCSGNGFSGKTVHAIVSYRYNDMDECTI